MKVLLVSSKYQPEYSGSGLRAHNTYKRLNKAFSIQYNVLSSSLEHTGTLTYKYDGIVVRRISGLIKISLLSGYWRTIAVWFNLPFEVFLTWNTVRKDINDYDLLHTFGDSWPVGFLTWYFSRKRKPIIRELCNEIPSPYYPKRFSFLIKPIFQQDIAMMVAISPMLEKLAIKSNVKHVWLRPNPVDQDKFNLKNRANRNNLREELTRFNNDDVVLAYVAAIGENKNQRFLLRLLSLLGEKYKLVMAGDVKKERRGYLKQIHSDIALLGLSERVELHEEFTEIPELYMSLADVYVFPSKHEGLGTPILEAQACGVPVVTNKLDGITDYWITEGEAGFSCQLNEKEWVDKIEKALRISPDVLEKNALKILKNCASTLIDSQYYRHLIALTNKN